MTEKITDYTKIIYIANPDNPMGTWHNAKAVQSFIEALPDNCLLVLDEAYIEFSPPGVDFAIDVDDPRVISHAYILKSTRHGGRKSGLCDGRAHSHRKF